MKKYSISLICAAVTLLFSVSLSYAEPSGQQICKKMKSDGRGAKMSQKDCMCMYRVADAVLDDDIKSVLFDSWYSGTNNIETIFQKPKQRRVEKQILTLKRTLEKNCGDIFSEPVSPQKFAVAKKAAAICARHAPNWNAAAAAFKAAGFSKTQDSRLKKIEKRQRAAILEKPEANVVILIGSRGGEGTCIVGQKGMRPKQSLELAQPWVKKYGAKTNAERGQGLSKKAVQAWGILEDKRIVYIAALKSWDVLGVPGSAARLMYINR